MKLHNFNETYLIEGFFDDLEDDLDNSDIVTTQITDIIQQGLDVITDYNLLYMCINDELVHIKTEPNKLNYFDISKYVNNTNALKYMFWKEPHIQYINFNYKYTTHITDLNHMFSECDSVSTIIFDNINTSNVTNMNYMFCLCSNLTEIDLHKFDTNKVTEMPFMFYGCHNLKSLDLSNFIITENCNVSYMFHDCIALESLNIPNFNPCPGARLSYMNMFENCLSLSNITCNKQCKDIIMNNNNIFNIPYLHNIKWNIV